MRLNSLTRTLVGQLGLRVLSRRQSKSAGGGNVAHKLICQFPSFGEEVLQCQLQNQSSPLHRSLYRWFVWFGCHEGRCQLAMKTDTSIKSGSMQARFRDLDLRQKLFRAKIYNSLRTS